MAKLLSIQGEESRASRVRNVDKVIQMCNFKALLICKILGNQGHDVVEKVMLWRPRTCSSIKEQQPPEL